MPEHDKLSIYPEEIEAEKEGLIESLLSLDDGRTLELFYDANNKEPRRFYIRDQNGKLMEFTDLGRPNDIYNYKDVQNDIAEKVGIMLTDHEAKKITKTLYERNVKREMDQKKVLE